MGWQVGDWSVQRLVLAQKTFFFLLLSMSWCEVQKHIGVEGNAQKLHVSQVDTRVIAGGGTAIIPTIPPSHLSSPYSLSIGSFLICWRIIRGGHTHYSHVIPLIYHSSRCKQHGCVLSRHQEVESHSSKYDFISSNPIISNKAQSLEWCDTRGGLAREW